MSKNPKLKACAHCGAPAKLEKGYSGRESWHWPKIICNSGHTFRLYVTNKWVNPADTGPLVRAWNTRYDPNDVSDLV